MRFWGYFLLVKPYLSPAFSMAVMWLLSMELREAARQGHQQGWFWANQVWVLKYGRFEGSAFPNGRPYLSWTMCKFYLDVVTFLGGPQISYCTWRHPFSSVGTTGSGSLAELSLTHKLLLFIPWYNCLAHRGKKQLRSIYSIFLFFR